MSVMNLFASWLRGARIQQTQYQSGGRPIVLEYVLPSGTGSRPVVILLHGSNGAASSAPTMRLVMQGLAGMGYAALFPHYFNSTGDEDLGAGPERDARIERGWDLWQQAVADAIEAAAQLQGTDGTRTALVGFSLGSYLSLGVAEAGPPVRCVIEFCGGLPENLRGQPLVLPPVLILHGEADTVVPVARAHELQAALSANGVIFEAHLYPGQGHVFSGTAEADALARCRSFLETYL
jgi:dienelactone hydrolase